MKKVLTIGLVLVLVLSIGMVSFAHYGSSRGTYGNAQGFGPGMMYGSDNTVIDSLSELTGLTELEIYQSGLPLHVIAEENDVLDEFLDLSLENRIERIEDLVENGNITEAYGELMISQMTEMHEYQKTEGGTFNNNVNFRGGGFCGRRW
ncbi:MAG TPA: hypothetical protein VJ962_09690 [Clostridia bacterium]|nr:hypothetical protein [Clostridia bacterium]